MKFYLPKSPLIMQKKLLMISKKKSIIQMSKVTNQLLLARITSKHLRRRLCFVNFVQKTEEQGILTSNLLGHLLSKGIDTSSFYASISPDIGQNLDGGIFNFRISRESLMD